MSKKLYVYDTVINFMVDNKITCPETIWQTDRVSENALNFINDLYDIVRDEVADELAELDKD